MSGDIQVGKLVAGLSMDTSGFTSGIQSAAGALDGLKATIGKVKAAMTALLTNPVVLAAAAIASLVALGKAAYDAFVEIDAAYDAIEVGTGAVGESLEGLKKSFDNVFANATYVAGAEELASVIADLNTYLGVTDEELEGLATQFSNLEGMGMSASVDTFSKAMNKWNIAAADAGKYLDYFYQISQNTGISIDELANSLASTKSTLDLFGFSLEESAQLMGAMNKAGYDSSSIQTALRQLAAQGVTTREQFEAVVSSIKNAKDSAEAMTLAVQAFGSRAGTEMVSLIQSGMLDNLGGSFEESAGAIDATAKSTEDFGDKMDRFGRSMQVRMAQAGAVINDILSKLFDAFEWFAGLGERLFAPIQKLFQRVGESFSKFWSEGEDNTGNAVENIMGFIESLVDKVAEGIEWFIDFVYPAIEVVIRAIVSIIKVFAALFAGDWETLFKTINDITVRGATLLYTIIQFIFDHVSEFIEDTLQAIVNWIFDRVNDVLGFFTVVANGAISMANSVIGALNKIPGINISEVAKVDWKVEAPDVAVARFANTGIGKGMSQYINNGGFDYEAVAANFAKSPVVVNVQGISDPYDVTVKSKEQSISAVYNPTRV